jgi:hypothetical protein
VRVHGLGDPDCLQSVWLPIDKVEGRQIVGTALRDCSLGALWELPNIPLPGMFSLLEDGACRLAQPYLGPSLYSDPALG